MVFLPKNPAGGVLEDGTVTPQGPICSVSVTQTPSLSALPPHPSTVIAVFTAPHFSAMVHYRTGKLADLAHSKIPLDGEKVSGYLKINSFITMRGIKCPGFSL